MNSENLSICGSICRLTRHWIEENMPAPQALAVIETLHNFISSFDESLHSQLSSDEAYVWGFLELFVAVEAIVEYFEKKSLVIPEKFVISCTRFVVFPISAFEILGADWFPAAMSLAQSRWPRISNDRESARFIFNVQGLIEVVKAQRIRNAAGAPAVSRIPPDLIRILIATLV